MINKEKKPRGRVVRVTWDDNRVFKQMLLDLYDRDVFRTPDQLADELFSYGLHVKANILRDENIK